MKNEKEKTLYTKKNMYYFYSTTADNCMLSVKILSFSRRRSKLKSLNI